MDREMSSDWRRPIRSASAPQRKAPTIIPKYTIRPVERAERIPHVKMFDTIYTRCVMSPNFGKDRVKVWARDGRLR